MAACTAQTPTTSESTPATTGQEQGQVEVEHLHGTATVPVTPERVVVFDIVSLDTLDALGVKPTAVAGSVFPTHLAHYGTDDLPKVGTLFEPDYEALAATNPDLIIIGGRSSAKYDELTKFGPTIDLSLSDDDYWGSTQKNARQLGKIFALEDEVEAQLTEIQTEVEAVAADTADAGNALVVLTTGGKMSAYGPASRFGILYSEFGFTPAAEGLDTSRHGEPISFEFIAKTDPDWLFVVDRDRAIGQEGESAQVFLDNPLVNESSAAKNGRIVYLDPANWYLTGGGLSTLKAMIDEIRQAVQAGQAS